MLDCCIKFYTSTFSYNKWYKYFRIDGFVRFFLWGIVNIFVPLIYILEDLCHKKRYLENNRKTKIVVSLTSFPGRINRLWIVIESIFRQSVTPDLIVLWLSKNQFSSLDTIPKKLINLQKKGLKIVLCEDDLRSHKKYYYAFKEFPNDIVITIDDDFFYSSHLIENMMNSFLISPNSILANRGLLISKSNDKILSYSNWEFAFSSNVIKDDFFFTSGGGTLFPPNCLHKCVLDQTVFLDICKYADDVWLNAMARLNKANILKIDSKYQLNIPLFILNDIKLTSINVNESMNDIQIENVRNYCKNTFNLDPFQF